MPLIREFIFAPQLYFVLAIENISDYVEAISVCSLWGFGLYVVFSDNKATVFALQTVLCLKA
jgi:hypothetical protein